MADQNDESIETLMRAQFGVVSRAQLKERGYNKAAIEWAVEKGLWVPASRGVYRAAAAPLTWRQRAMGACLIDDEAALSHLAAAFLWKLDGIKMPRVIDISSPTRHRRTEAGVRWHLARLDPRQRSTRHQLPVTHLPRTLLDVMPVLGETAAEVAVESALRLYPQLRSWMIEELGRVGGRGFALTPRLRELLGSVDELRESALEVVVDKLLFASGVPRMNRQHKVLIDGRFVARLDFALPAVRFGVQAQGYAFHHGKGRFEKDQRQASVLQSHGWRLLFPTWDWVHDRPQSFIEEVRRTYLLASAEWERSGGGSH